jgi:hypothetical protein
MMTWYIAIGFYLFVWGMMVGLIAADSKVHRAATKA